MTNPSEDSPLEYFNGKAKLERALIESRLVVREAWLELIVDEPSTLKKKILEAGPSRIEYLGNDFLLPGTGGIGHEDRITGRELNYPELSL